MKKILEMLLFASLGIFFVVCSSSDVFASGSNAAPDGTQSYYFAQAQINDDATGNYAPSPIKYETNYTQFRFGYFDVTDSVFPKNERIRMTALFCSTRRTTDNMFNRYTLDGNVGMEILDFQYKNMGACASVDSDGHILFLGKYIYFQIDFRIPPDSSLGFANYTLYSNQAGGKQTIKFMSYKIFYNDEAIKEDIINNNNQNTQDIINNQDKNNQEIIDNQNKNHQEQLENDNKNQQQTNERLDGIKDSINDDTPPEVNNAFGDIKLDKDSAISDLLLLPIKYLQRMLNLSSKTCSPYSLNFGIFGSNYILKLPCINLQSFFGSQLWTTIDYLICFFMIYEIVMLFIKAFEDLTSLRDTYDSLYQPKHAESEYQPKHGGGS